MNSILVFLILLFSLIWLVYVFGIPKTKKAPEEPFVSFQYDIKEGSTIPISTPLPQYAGSSADQNISKTLY
jgi:hypothetical protein